VLIDRSHRGWIVFSILALAAASAYYAFYNIQSYKMGGNGPSGASWTGLVYGFIGFGMMIFCGLLGIRRTVRIWKIGKGQAWLRAHIWLGLIAYPIILMHAGLKFGNNLSLVLMILFTIVLISGIFGIILQNVLPRSLLVRVPAESTFEQIPYVISKLRDEADSIVRQVCGPLGNEKPQDLENDNAAMNTSTTAVKSEGKVQGRVLKAKVRMVGTSEGSAPLKNFYLTEVQPFLHPELKKDSPLTLERSAVAVFEHAKTLVPETLHEALGDLQSVCEERRQLALQERLHFWLHSWEFVHIPLSYALLALSVIHAIMAVLNY
jgi:vacuolar-type H+-ATPase subunit I/STV1